MVRISGLGRPRPDENGRNGWRILSRRARRFASEAELARYVAVRFLQRDALNGCMADKVWLAFMRGEFDVAVFQAMKAVEVSVRDAAGLGNNLVGVSLMREAFAVDKGPLAIAQQNAANRSHAWNSLQVPLDRIKISFAP